MKNSDLIHILFIITGLSTGGAEMMLQNFRALNEPWLLKEVYAGKQFADGEMVTVSNKAERKAA